MEQHTVLLTEITAGDSLGDLLAMLLPMEGYGNTRTGLWVGLGTHEQAICSLCSSSRLSVLLGLHAGWPLYTNSLYTL